MPEATQWGAAGEVAASRHGAITRSQAAHVGISRNVVRRMVRDQWLDTPAPGVLVVAGAPPTWRQQLAIATSTSRGSLVAGFRSAAALHGLDQYPPGRVELLCPSGRRPPLPGAVIHTGPLDGCDITEVDGIRTTTVARTLADLGSVDPITRVRFAFESAWRRGVSLDALQLAVDRLHRPGQRGTGVLQRLLVEARLHQRPTESGLEVELACILAGVAGLQRQHEIRDAAGGFVARVDFAIPEARLAIEAHSRQHHFGSAAARRDGDRHERIVAAGFRVMYVTKSDMATPIKVRQRVLAAALDESTHPDPGPRSLVTGHHPGAL